MGDYTLRIEAQSSHGYKTVKYTTIHYFDDDAQAPLVAVDPVLQTILDSENTISFHVTTSDPSDVYKSVIDFNGNTIISTYTVVDNIFVLPSPRTPGFYPLRVAATDNDNDRDGDRSTIAWTGSVIIEDDDITSPTIASVLNDPVISDKAEVLVVTVDCSDDSGMGSVGVRDEYTGHIYWGTPVGGDLYEVIVPSPRVPGTYSMEVVVTDADTDRPGDQLSASQEITFVIYDEDELPPVIEDIQYLPVITDAETYLHVAVTATDAANGIYNVFVYLGGVGYTPVLVDGDTYHFDVWNPREPGDYTAEVVAWDADMDWGTLDQLCDVEEITFSIKDDDDAPPDITNVNFLGNNLDTDPYVWMQMDISDVSGVGLVTVDFNGDSYVAGLVGNSYYFAVLPTPGLAGTYTAHVTALDLDYDRPGDQSVRLLDVPVTIINTAPRARLYYSNIAAAGEYPGTYTFSDRDPVPFLMGWQAGVQGVGGQPAPGKVGDYCRIIPEYAGHAGVLQLYKNASVAQVLAAHFAGREIPAGTVEFWLAVDGDANFMAVLGSFTAGISGPWVMVIQGQLLYMDASGDYRILAPFTPGWHHLRVDFAGTGGTFPGLAENQVMVTLDGTSFGAFDAGAPLHVAGFIAGASEIGGATEPAIGSLYLDAVGFSWDPNYILGTNQFPGVDLTPRDYTGEYRATYTFSPADSLPATQGWVFMAGGQTFPLMSDYSLPEYLGHQTVLKVSAGSGSNLRGAVCPLVPARVAGTVELWLALEGDEGTLAVVSAMVDEEWIIFAAINDGQLSVLNEAGTYTPLHSFATGEWHHLRLDFAGPDQSYLGLGANQYRLFLDQEDLGTFSSGADLSLDYFVLALQNVAGTGVGQLYVDAVGFSWDPNYAIGQNLVVSGPPETPVLTIDEGEPGATMTWAPKDVSFEATSYSLYVDGILSTTGVWTYGSRISRDLSTLAPGEHLLSTVFDDGIGGITTSSIIVHVIGPQEELSAEIDAIIAAIESSSDADWRCPAGCRKGAMIEKLEEVKALVAAGRYTEAYNKLLHDVKPKLTGLKTDENEIPWGNGVERKPWVTSPALQQAFKDMLNPVLQGIKSLADSTPRPPCHGHHGGHHHGCHYYHAPHPGGNHHCNAHHGSAHGPNHGHGHQCGSGNPPACHACW